MGSLREQDEGAPQTPLNGVRGQTAKGRVTHSTAVRMAIENDIFNGRLLPGTPVDEDELAQRFNISRTPVREAMLQLVQSGLIEKKARRQATVAKLDLSRLIHMFEMVSELEALCARLAASRMTDAEREGLVKVHKDADAALRAGDEAKYARLGRQFHTLIMDGSHNDVVIETTSKLALHTLSYRRFQVRKPDHAQQNQNFHTTILEAILAKDGAEAFEQMRKHVTVQGDVLADYIAIGGVGAPRERGYQ